MEEPQPISNQKKDQLDVMDIEFDDLFESPGAVPSIKNTKSINEKVNNIKEKEQKGKDAETEEKKKNKKAFKKDKKSNIIQDEEKDNANPKNEGSKELVETKMKPREKKKTNQTSDNTDSTAETNDNLEDDVKKEKRKKKEKNENKKQDNDDEDLVTKKKEKKTKKEKKDKDDEEGKKEVKKEKASVKRSKSKSKNKNSNTSNLDNDNGLNEGSGGDELISQLNLSSDEERKVIKYMLQQNRPYSILNLFDNLRGAIKKKLLENTLNSLVEKGYIISKQYNSMVYLINQSLFPPINETEIKKLNDKISNLEKSITDAQEKNNKYNNELKHVKTQYTDKELDELLTSLKEKIKNKKERINKFKSNSTEKIPEEKMLELKKKYEENVKNYKKIRKTVFEIADTFSEGFEISRKEFMENYGLDDDKDLVNNLLLPLK